MLPASVIEAVRSSISDFFYSCWLSPLLTHMNIKQYPTESKPASTCATTSSAHCRHHRCTFSLAHGGGRYFTALFLSWLAEPRLHAARFTTSVLHHLGVWAACDDNVSSSIKVTWVMLTAVPCNVNTQPITALNMKMTPVSANVLMPRPALSDSPLKEKESELEFSNTQSKVILCWLLCACSRRDSALWGSEVQPHLLWCSLQDR